jgi:hypothetical protein
LVPAPFLGEIPDAAWTAGVAVLVARWNHVFSAGFTPRGGVRFRTQIMVSRPRAHVCARGCFPGSRWTPSRVRFSRGTTLRRVVCSSFFLVGVPV